MILLKPELFEKLQTATPEDLSPIQDALQNAIMLEHATIPTYLYAYYSLQPDANKEIQDLLGSIFIEEMLHMSLDCNILNAIGGTPVINKPGFIPTYPGPLPGGIDNGLTVPLQRFSTLPPGQEGENLVHDVFMVIEEPEDPLKFPVAASLEEQPRTIGQFYAAILLQLQIAEAEAKLSGGTIFTGDPRLQVTSPYFPSDQLFPVTDLADAERAIDIIVEQGEGTKTTPDDLEGEYAHYYKYAEIYYGKTLIKNPHATSTTPSDQQYIYGGAPIPFDASKVYPVVANPKAADYALGSKARIACDTFNYTYTSMLNALHLTFNGAPDQLDTAIGLMASIRTQALALVQIPLGDGTNAGPSFEYQPTLPG